jgi:GMP synthase-like glutamine amidotransferase
LLRDAVDGTAVRRQGRNGKIGPNTAKHPYLSTILTDLLTNVEDGSTAWMSHGDSCVELPAGFEILAHTDNTDCAAIADHQKKLFGVQFHPEVVHSVGGIALIR